MTRSSASRSLLRPCASTRTGRLTERVPARAEHLGREVLVEALLACTQPSAPIQPRQPDVHSLTHLGKVHIIPIQVRAVPARILERLERDIVLGQLLGQAGRQRARDEGGHRRTVCVWKYGCEVESLAVAEGCREVYTLSSAKRTEDRVSASGTAWMAIKSDLETGYWVGRGGCCAGGDRHPSSPPPAGCRTSAPFRRGGTCSASPPLSFQFAFVALCRTGEARARHRCSCETSMQLCRPSRGHVRATRTHKVCGGLPGGPASPPLRTRVSCRRTWP